MVRKLGDKNTFLVLIGLLLSGLMITAFRTTSLSAGANNFALAWRSGAIKSTPVTGLAAGTNATLSFEENQGQADPATKFLARIKDSTILLSDDEAVIRLHGNPEPHFDSVHIRFAGARYLHSPAGRERQPGSINYFVGDRSHWQTGIRSFAKVEYQQLYRGIDLVFYGNRQRLEYDFVLGVGSDPASIGLDITGITNVRIDDADGSLVLQTRSRTLRQSKPFMYQDINGTLRVVNGKYKLTRGNRIGFDVESYDKTRPLIIDPVLTFATYLGASGLEEANAVATDANGNTYVTGCTDSAGLSNLSGRNVYVAKFNTAGTVREYLSVFGGSGDEEGRAIAVDSTGNVIVTGQTDSRDFTTTNPLQTLYGGGAHDAFVTKLKADGSALVFSTYFGGAGDDTGNGIASDISGNAYLTGSTDSPEYSNISGRNCFIAKLNSTGSERNYLAILGGSGEDIGNAIAIDTAGSAYVVGSSDSVDLSLVAPVQPQFGGGTRDAFLAKLNANGSALEFATYFGGSGDDVAAGIAIDATGNSYITGSSDSPEISTTGRHVFVAKFSNDGASRIYLNTFGGDGQDYGNAIALDAETNAYVTGSTDSANFTLVNAIQSNFGGGQRDAFLAGLDSQGSALSYCTFLGGAGDDVGYGIAVAPNGQVNVVGATTSTDFPILMSLQNTNGGGSDAFLIRMSAASGPGPSPTATATPTVSPTPVVIPRPVPILLTQPNSNRAIALDSVTFARDPFPITTDLNFSIDKRTRIILFVTNLQLLPNEDQSVITVRAVDSRNKSYSLLVEYVGTVPNVDWLSSVVVKLPDDQTISGDMSIVISLPGVTSNSAIVGIRAP